MVEEKDVAGKKVSPYRLNLKPGEEGFRPQWNLVFISDIPVTVDFFHTDMLERIISIKKADSAIEENKEVEG